MQHENALTFANDNSAVEDVEVLTRGCKEDQITGLQMRPERRQRRFGDALQMHPLCRESRHDIKDAFFRHRPRSVPDSANDALALIVADPGGHIVIAPVPLNSSVFVTDLSQPFDKI